MQNMDMDGLNCHKMGTKTGYLGVLRSISVVKARQQLHRSCTAAAAGRIPASSHGGRCLHSLATQVVLSCSPARPVQPQRTKDEGDEQQHPRSLAPAGSAEQ